MPEEASAPSDSRYERVLIQVAEDVGVIGGDQTPGRRVPVATSAWEPACSAYDIRNPADVRSSYASGRRTIPDAIQKDAPEGFLWHLEYVGGDWSFHLREPDTDPFEADDNLFTVMEIDDLTPRPLVKDVVSWDEQVVLRVMGANQMYAFLGFRHWIVQAHKRTTVDGSHIEVDGLGVAVAGAAVPREIFAEPVRPGERVVTAEEIKMPNEPFTALHLQKAARHAQEAYVGHRVLPIASSPYGKVRAGSPLKGIDMVAFGWDRETRLLGPPRARFRFIFLN